MKTKTIQFETKEGLNPDVWERIKGEIEFLPDGMYECVIRKPKRTLKQNSLIHGLFDDLAVELNGIGIELSFGNFSASFTPESAKEFFKQIYLAGKKTSECTTKELSNAIEKVIADVNSRGGTLSVDGDDMKEFNKFYGVKEKGK